MKKEVLLTIRAEQRFRDEEPETTELVTEGQLSVRGSRVEFSYEESELTGLTGLDPYFDTLEDLRRTLPVISHGCYLAADGSEIASLTDAQQSALDLLADWKYYRLKEEALIQ